MKYTVKSVICEMLIALCLFSFVVAAAALECDCIGFLAFSIWIVLTFIVSLFAVRNYNMEQNKLDIKKKE